jgi:hypothetical protein
MTLRQRQPRETNPRFLAFVRQQRCCVCGHWPPVQAAHIRMGNITRGVRHVGMGERPSDCRAVPLCADCHLDGPGALHKVGEARFWARVGINPFVIAEALYAQFQGAGAP